MRKTAIILSLAIAIAAAVPTSAHAARKNTERTKVTRERDRDVIQEIQKIVRRVVASIVVTEQPVMPNP